MNQFRFSRYAAIVLAFALLPTSAWAQRLNLNEYPEVDLDSIAERHRKWFEEEVTWILTETEREVFVRLDTDEKRDSFIEEFWTQRDPTPGTPRNEYREEYDRRYAFVERFGRGTSRPGWQTDQGRMYLLLGPPQYTSGVPGDMLTYPLEVWFYAGAVELGLPPFHYLMFYQRYGSGEYRLYSPLSDGPEKLMNPSGMRAVEDMKNSRQQTPGFAPTGFRDPNVEYIYYILRDIDIDVASAAISLFPSEAGLEYGITPLRSEMLLGDIQQVPERLMPDTTYAYNILTGVTESDVRFETVEIEAMATPLIDVDGQPFIHFAAQTPGENLNLNNYQDKFYFSFDASGSVTTAELKVLQTFDANLSGELDPDAARRFRDTNFLYLDLLPTVPGRQTFEMVIENKVAHTFGRAVFDFDVPKARPEQLRLLGPVLGQAVQENPDYDLFGDRFPFQYRGQAMVPAPTARYARGAPVVVFGQILLPTGHDRPLEIRLELLDSAGTALQDVTQPVDLALADQYGVISPILSLPTDDLAAGTYRVRLSLIDEPTGAASAQLEVFEATEAQVLPFISAQSAPPATDVMVYVERARQYAVLGQMEAALVLLRDARSRDPENGQVIQAYVETLDDAGEYAELIEYVAPVVARNPRATDGMTMLGKAHANLGQHYDAIRYYERARIALGQDTVEILNPLASEYAAEGNVVKARELLARSLELNEAQPEIRRLLDQLSGATTEPAQ